jgi:hypothetical protein
MTERREGEKGSPEAITAARFAKLVFDGELEPGDLVCHDYASRGIVDATIERVQRRLLADLVGPHAGPTHAYMTRLLGESWLQDAATFTHVSTVLSPFAAGEMTHPRARSLPWWQRLAPGDRIRVRRPYHALTERFAPGHARRDIRLYCRCDIDAGLGYPASELLHYWLWSWGFEKLLLGRKFMRVFSTERADVCSGRYWHWAQSAGCWHDLDEAERRPEGHYPAELAVSFRFQTLAEYRIVADAAPGNPVPVPPFQPQPLEART